MDGWRIGLHLVDGLPAALVRTVLVYSLHGAVSAVIFRIIIALGGVRRPRVDGRWRPAWSGRGCPGIMTAWRRLRTPNASRRSWRASPAGRRLKDGAPHPEDLRDIVDAVLKVTKPGCVLLFGSGARGEMTDDSDIDILVIRRGAPGGTLKLKLVMGNARPLGLRWTDVLVLTPAGLRKRLHEWADEALAEVLGEARTLYEGSGG